MLKTTKKTFLVALSALTASAYALPIEQYSESYVKSPVITAADTNDFFGYSVAIDGDYMVVGVPQEDSLGNGPFSPPFMPWAGNAFGNNGGAAWVYKRQTNNSWQPMMYLKPFNTGTGGNADDRFGHSVSISGDTIVVGALNEDGDADSCTAPTPCVNNDAMTNSGAAYVFVRQPNTETWAQQAFLKADDRSASANFGQSVSIDGATIAVGANEAAYIYTRGVTWSQQAKITAGNSNAGDSFGSALALDGDHLIVGAYNEDSNGSSIADNSLSNSGAAYVYHRSGSTWSQQAFLKAGNLDSGDEFGFSVALDEGVAVIGSRFEDGNGSNADNNTAMNAGAAYIFELDGSNWKQTAYLKPYDVQDSSYFGRSVAVNDDTVVVGSTRGVNADAGAAYAYRKSGTSWQRISQLTQAVSNPIDVFGFAVAISKTAPHNIAVTARNEDSGVTANPNDNSVTANGAAYVFHSPATQNLPQSGTTYTIGGVLTGLPAATPITLRNTHSAGTQDLALTGAGVNVSSRFAFPSPIDGIYGVSAFITPTGYACEVNNGAGDTQDVGGYGNVTDVYVNCGHSVGGNVTGLLSGGVLTLTNAGESLSINADGNFSFDNITTNGSNYNIRVQSQPTGQNCTVNSGVGSVSANVTNVSVSCLANAVSTYHVGGTISGLAAGESVTLTNGSETKTFAGNGNFNFNVAGSDGGNYAVSVTSQPNGQACTVANNSGSISGSNVSNVAVDCRTNGVARYNVSGAWYDPVYDGSGFVMMQTPIGLSIAYFGYKGSGNGNAQWLVSELIHGDSLEAGRTYEVNMRSGYPGNGGTLTTKPNLPTVAGNGTQYWGKLRLRIDSCSQGQAVLIDKNTTDGNDGSISLALQPLYGVNDVNCSGAANVSKYTVSGLWYDPTLNGSGFYVSETPVGLMTTYFGYKGSGNGEAFWTLSDTLATSATVEKNTSYNFVMYAGTLGNGGNFARKPTTGSGTQVWGSMDVTFDGCNSGTITLNGNDGTVTQNVVRLGNVQGVTCTE